MDRRAPRREARLERNRSHPGRRLPMRRAAQARRPTGEPVNRSALGLAAFIGGAGATHFVNPGFYDPIVPRALPGPARFWTYASGAAELAVAATVALPKSRR